MQEDNRRKQISVKVNINVQSGSIICNVCMFISGSQETEVCILASEWEVVNEDYCNSSS